MRLFARPGDGPPGRGRRPLALILALLALFQGCGHIPGPPPEGWNAEEYTTITYDQLLTPREAGLAAGQKVAVKGYFWQYLVYDPAIVPNYLTLAAHPLTWHRLRWAALYRTPRMKGYFNRLALDADQKKDFRLQRLDSLRIYGELASLGLGVLYLRVHHVDKLDREKPLEGPEDAPPTAPSRETEP